MRSKINILFCVWVYTLTPLVYIYHLFFKGEGLIPEFVLEGEYRSEHHLYPQPSGGSEGWIPAQRDSPQMGKFFFLYIHFIMVTFINYLFNYLPWTFLYLFCLHFTPLWFIFPEGESVRIPATSYLVALFTLVYQFFFTLLLPYNLDVPCYSPNRQRYCSAWPERIRTLYNNEGVVRVVVHECSYR